MTSLTTFTCTLIFNCFNEYDNIINLIMSCKQHNLLGFPNFQMNYFLMKTCGLCRYYLVGLMREWDAGEPVGGVGQVTAGLIREGRVSAGWMENGNEVAD